MTVQRVCRQCYQLDVVKFRYSACVCRCGSWRNCGIALCSLRSEAFARAQVFFSSLINQYGVLRSSGDVRSAKDVCGCDLQKTTIQVQQ